MKWIGQHIYDLVARFRDDVYLEDISSGTIASGGNLGLDSNNKIVKQSDTGITDLHGAGVDGSANQLLTDDGDGTVTSEANLTFDGSTLSLTGAFSMTGDTATFTSANADDPAFIIQNTTDDNQAARLQLIKNRGAAGQDDDKVAELELIGYNDAGTPEQIKFGKIFCEIDDATDGEESGSLALSVASHNGGLREFLRGTGGSQANETDVTIGNTATSLTTISGTLTMGSTATLNNSGLLQVANQSNITGVGTITSGTWEGTTVAIDQGGTGNTTGVQGGKNYRILNCSFRDDIGTTKHYLPFKSQDEQTVLTREEVSELAVCDGRVVSVTLRVENLNTHSGDATVTFGVETNVVGTGYDNFTEIETEAITVNNADDSHLYHAVFSTAKHWDSTDMFAISITSDTDISGSNERFFITVVVEDDWSTYLAGSTREIDSTP